MPKRDTRPGNGFLRAKHDSNPAQAPSSIPSTVAVCAATELSEARHGEHSPRLWAGPFAGQKAGPPSTRDELAQYEKPTPGANSICSTLEGRRSPVPSDVVKVLWNPY